MHRLTLYFKNYVQTNPMLYGECVQVEPNIVLIDIYSWSKYCII